MYSGNQRRIHLSSSASQSVLRVVMLSLGCFSGGPYFCHTEVRFGVRTKGLPGNVNQCLEDTSYRSNSLSAQRDFMLMKASILDALALLPQSSRIKLSFSEFREAIHALGLREGEIRDAFTELDQENCGWLNVDALLSQHHREAKQISPRTSTPTTEALISEHGRFFEPTRYCIKESERPFLWSRDCYRLHLRRQKRLSSEEAKILLRSRVSEATREHLYEVLQTLRKDGTSRRGSTATSFEDFVSCCKRFNIELEETEARQCYESLCGAHGGNSLKLEGVLREFLPAQKTTLPPCKQVDCRDAERLATVAKWKDMKHRATLSGQAAVTRVLRRSLQTMHGDNSRLWSRFASGIKSGDGRGVGYQQFKRIFTDLLLDVSESDAQAVFAALDRHNTGAITLDDLHAFCHSTDTACVSVSEWVDRCGGWTTRQAMALAQKRASKLFQSAPPLTSPRNELKAKIEAFGKAGRSTGLHFVFRRLARVHEGDSFDFDTFFEFLKRINITSDRTIAKSLFEDILRSSGRADTQQRSISFDAFARFVSPPCGHANDDDSCRADDAKEALNKTLYADARNRQLEVAPHKKSSRRLLSSLSPDEVALWFTQHGLQAWGTVLVAHHVTGHQLSRGIDDAALLEMGVTLRVVRARILTLLSSARVHGVDLLEAPDFTLSSPRIMPKAEPMRPKTAANAAGREAHRLVEACKTIDVDCSGLVSQAELMYATAERFKVNDLVAVEAFVSSLPVDDEGYFAYAALPSHLSKHRDKWFATSTATLDDEGHTPLQRQGTTEQLPLCGPSSLATKLRRRWNALTRLLAKADMSRKKARGGFVPWAKFVVYLKSVGIDLDRRELDFVSVHFCSPHGEGCGPAVYYPNLLRFVADSVFGRAATRAVEDLPPQREDPVVPAESSIAGTEINQSLPDKIESAFKAAAASSASTCVPVRTFRNTLRSNGISLDEYQFFRLLVRISRDRTTAFGYVDYHNILHQPALLLDSLNYSDTTKNHALGASSPCRHATAPFDNLVTPLSPPTSLRAHIPTSSSPVLAARAHRSIIAGTNYHESSS